MNYLVGWCPPGEANETQRDRTLQQNVNRPISRQQTTASIQGAILEEALPDLPQPNAP